VVDYTFTEDQELFRESMKEFCAQQIIPKLELLEGAEEMPMEIIKALADFELLGMRVEEKYGGIDVDPMMVGIAAEELARADPSCAVPVLFLVENSWGHVLSKYGTEELKQEILPKVVKGELFLGIATTESDIGSDLGNMKTQIRAEGDGYVVNGEKMYISGVAEVQKYGGGHVTLGRMDMDAGTRGMCMFYLPQKGVEGITPTLLKEFGREGISCGGFNIENVKIPKHYLMHEEKVRGHTVQAGRALRAPAGPARAVVQGPVDIREGDAGEGHPHGSQHGHGHVQVGVLHLGLRRHQRRHAVAGRLRLHHGVRGYQSPAGRQVLHARRRLGGDNEAHNLPGAPGQGLPGVQVKGSAVKGWADSKCSERMGGK